MNVTSAQLPQWGFGAWKIDFANGISNVATGSSLTVKTPLSYFDGSSLIFLSGDEKLKRDNGNVLANSEPFHQLTSTDLCLIPYQKPGNSCENIGYLLPYSYSTNLQILITQAMLYYDNFSFNNNDVVLSQNQQNAYGDVLSPQGQNAYAISKLTPDGKRYMYYPSPLFNCIYKFEISNSIHFTNYEAVSTSNLGSLGYSVPGGINYLNAIDADLSHDSKKFAFANGETDDIASIALASVGGDYTSTGSVHFNLGGGKKVVGVEYDQSGDKLFFAVYSTTSNQNGIYWINLITSTINGPISGSTLYNNTQLEMGSDGYIYCGRFNGTNYYLGKIDPINNTFASETIVPSLPLFNSVLGGVVYDYITLPDAVDGESYPLQPTSGTWDLYTKDSNNDQGYEPNSNDTYSDIWESPDLIISQNAGTSFTPEPFKAESNNFYKIRFRNRGCVPSESATVKLYWTRARGAETWTEHWISPGINSSSFSINCPGRVIGKEISPKNPSTGIFDNTIPPIPQNLYLEKIFLAKHDNAAQTSDVPLLENWGCVEQSISNPLFIGPHPMICILSRIIHTNDQMHNELLGNIAPNVFENNNISTRNTHILKYQGKKGLDFEQGQYLSLMVNNPDTVSSFVSFEISSITHPGGSLNYLNYGDIYVTMSDTLLSRWISAGKLISVDNLLDKDSKTILFQSADKLRLDSILIKPGELFELGIKFEPHEDYKNAFNHEYDNWHYELNSDYTNWIERKLNYRNLIDYYSLIGHDSLFTICEDYYNELLNSQPTDTVLTFKYLIQQIFNNRENRTFNIVGTQFVKNSLLSSHEKKELYKPEIKSNIYPNPTNGFVTIDAIDFNESYTIRVLDCFGRLVFYQNKNYGKIELDLSRLANQVYLFELTSISQHKSLKLIKL